MASSTLIFSRWILPFLFSFTLSLFFSSSPRFLSNRNRRYRDDEKNRANEKSSQPLRSPDDRFEHNVDRDTRLWSQRQWYSTMISKLFPSPVAVSRVGHSSEPNEEEPCRRPGKTRFPGNCTRVRNPAVATKVAVDRGFPLLLAHRSCALGPDPPCPKDDLLISRLPAESCLAIFG